MRPTRIALSGYGSFSRSPSEYQLSCAQTPKPSLGEPLRAVGGVDAVDVEQERRRRGRPSSAARRRSPRRAGRRGTAARARARRPRSPPCRRATRGRRSSRRSRRAARTAPCPTRSGGRPAPTTPDAPCTGATTRAARAGRTRGRGAGRRTCTREQMKTSQPSACTSVGTCAAYCTASTQHSAPTACASSETRATSTIVPTAFDEATHATTRTRSSSFRSRSS